MSMTAGHVVKSTTAAFLREYAGLITVVERAIKSEEAAAFRAKAIQKSVAAIIAAERVIKAVAVVTRREGVMKAITVTIALLVVAIVLPAIY